MNHTAKSNGQATKETPIINNGENTSTELSPRPKSLEEVQSKINNLKAKSDEVSRLKQQMLEVSSLTFSKEVGRGKVTFVDDNGNVFEIRNIETVSELRGLILKIGKDHIDKVEAQLMSASL